MIAKAIAIRIPIAPMVAIARFKRITTEQQLWIAVGECKMLGVISYSGCTRAMRLQEVIEYFEELESLMMCELVLCYHSIKAARRNSKLELEVIARLISKRDNRSIKMHIIHKLVAAVKIEAIGSIVAFE